MPVPSRPRGWFPRAVLLAVFVTALVGFAGCGGSGSSESTQQQLEAAKREGEEAAREKDRITSLQHQVKQLKRQGHKTAPAVAAPSSQQEQPAPAPQGEAPVVLRSFHAPSGNVSCEILSNGALCSVDSTAETFSFSDGEAAHEESGSTLSRSSGELAPYGSTVSAGSVTCTIPQSNEPRGIVCTDSESGHGFEASRVGSRQSVY